MIAGQLPQGGILIRTIIKKQGGLTMTDAHLIAFEQIERKIYRLHGQKIMPDRDLAELYGVDTRTLN